MTGGEDFSFKLIKIKETVHEYEILGTFGARGPVLQMIELRPGFIAVSDNNIV